MSASTPAQGIHFALQVLAGHVVPAAVRIGDLFDGQVLPTLADEPLTVSIDAGTGAISVAAANGGSVATLALFGDFEACSAIVHVIDAVLMPGDEPEDAELVDEVAPEVAVNEELTGEEVADEAVEEVSVDEEATDEVTGEEVADEAVEEVAVDEEATDDVADEDVADEAVEEVAAEPADEAVVESVETPGALCLNGF